MLSLDELLKLVEENRDGMSDELYLKVCNDLKKKYYEVNISDDNEDDDKEDDEET